MNVAQGDIMGKASWLEETVFYHSGIVCQQVTIYLATFKYHNYIDDPTLNLANCDNLEFNTWIAA